MAGRFISRNSFSRRDGLAPVSESCFQSTNSRSSELSQERGERVHRQVAGVGGGLRQATDFPNQLFPAYVQGFVYILAFDQLRDGRPARHRRNAALGTKANIGDATAFQF